MSAKESEAAQVEPGVPGRDGFVELLFETALQPGRIDADGHMDFLDRGLRVSAEPGQALARIHPYVATRAPKVASSAARRPRFPSKRPAR